MKKFIYVSVVLALLLSAFSIGAFALSDTGLNPSADGGAARYTEAVSVPLGYTDADSAPIKYTDADGAALEYPGSDGAPIKYTDADGATPENTEEVGETPENTEEVGAQKEEKLEESEENFFEVVYCEVVKHADKILSALAFCGSVILAFAYKRGLLPAIQTTITGLGNQVGALKEYTEKSITLSDSTQKVALERFDEAQTLMKSLGTRLEELESALAEAEEEKNQRAATQAIMLAQIDMLYEVFMSSSLPAYRKDLIGEKIANMKKDFGLVGDSSNEGA